MGLGLADDGNPPHEGNDCIPRNTRMSADQRIFSRPDFEVFRAHWGERARPSARDLELSARGPHVPGAEAAKFARERADATIATAQPATMETQRAQNSRTWHCDRPMRARSARRETLRTTENRRSVGLSS